MWFVVAGLALAVIYLAAKAPTSPSVESVPPSNVVPATGAAIPSPATAGLPTASAAYQVAQSTTYLFPGVKPPPGQLRPGTEMKTAQSVQAQTPGAALPDGGQQLATQVAPPRPAATLGVKKITQLKL